MLDPRSTVCNNWKPVGIDKCKDRETIDMKERERELDIESEETIEKKKIQLTEYSNTKMNRRHRISQNS